MARVSTKENKNIYHTTRENLGLTREAASDLLESISPERIEKIENERSLPHPDEIEVCGFAAESVIKIEDKPFHWCPLHTLTSFTLLERGAFLPCPCMYTIL